MSHWDSAIQKASPYLVNIDTPSGFGTGFLCMYNANETWCGIATACHVVANADRWQQPIRIHNYNFTKTVFLKETERVILTDNALDSAVILLSVPDLDLPKSLIQLRPSDSLLSIGAEIGWLGYPYLEPDTLCFFSGNISARKPAVNAYLIDGVAINGVSGGPVLYCDETEGVQFVGAVSAYRANRQHGETLPGLLIAQDVSHFHKAIQTVNSWDDAARKRAELEANKEKDSAPPPESTKPATQQQQSTT